MSHNPEPAGISVPYLAAQLNISDTAIMHAIRAGKITHEYNSETKRLNEISIKKNAWVLSKLVDKKVGSSKEKLIDKLNKRVEEVRESNADILASDFDINAGMTMQQAMVANEILSAALRKTKLQEAEGILIKREMVERVLFNLGTELKKELFNIPKRIAREIMVCKNEIEAINILNEEFRRVLNNYGNLKPESFGKK